MKSGNNYTAQVDKFSFWNWDAPAGFILLDYTLINASTNTPLVYANSRIKKVTNGINSSYIFNSTNNTGYSFGAVPVNESLILEVLSGCGTVIYSQNIGPFNTNTSLGNILVSLPASQYINFVGTLLNCSSSPVINGYVSFYATGGYNAVVNTNLAGSFSFSILNNCGNSLAYSFIGFDNTTLQESPILNSSAISGSINLGNITACSATQNVDVYIAGFEETSLVGGVSVAKVWKNGISTSLSNILYNARANSVFVSGSDVYVAGSESNAAGINVAKLWKNGTATNLTNGAYSASANSVFALGNDVYVVGNENSITRTIAKVWKNGIATNLSDGTLNAYGRSIYVSGSDVYVAGYEGIAGSISIAKIWKNGIGTNLNTTLQSFEANSIFVSGSDVYVAGGSTNSVQGERAMVWKNNVLTNLTDGTRQANAHSVYVLGSDVYVSGYERDVSGQSLGNMIPKVWKNGLAIILPDNTPNFIGGNAYSVFPFGNTIYATGYGSATFTSAKIKLWRNGIKTDITDGTKTAFGLSIFVK